MIPRYRYRHMPAAFLHPETTFVLTTKDGAIDLLRACRALWGKGCVGDTVFSSRVTDATYAVQIQGDRSKAFAAVAKWKEMDRADQTKIG